MKRWLRCFLEKRLRHLKNHLPMLIKKKKGTRRKKLISLQVHAQKMIDMKLKRRKENLSISVREIRSLMMCDKKEIFLKVELRRKWKSLSRCSSEIIAGKCIFQRLENSLSFYSCRGCLTCWSRKFVIGNFCVVLSQKESSFTHPGRYQRRRKRPNTCRAFLYRSPSRCRLTT